MGSTMPLLRFGKGLLLAVLLVAVAACARTPTTGVGNISGDAAGGGGAPGSQQEFLVSVGDRVFFETDSSVLTADAQATLDQQSQWLQQYAQYRIVIEGHADERGTKEYNLALGERRANAVQRFLIVNGASRGQLETVSYGEEKPAVMGSSESAWAQNRRVELVFE